MSEIAKSFAKARLANLPTDPPYPDEIIEDDSSSASSMSSTGTIRPTTTTTRAMQSTRSWSDFFDQELYLEQQANENGQPSAKYHVFITPPATTKDALIVVHHGAGSSALSFALCVVEI